MRHFRISVFTDLCLGIALLTSVLLAASCGADTTQQSARLAGPGPQTAANQAEALPSSHELEALLLAEFERLGIDPAKVPASAPKGNENAVFDLSFEVLAPEGDELSSIELSWTERLVGDYDQNGLVNIGDLTPLGAAFRATIDYRSPGDADGLEIWPLGDPDDSGTSDAPAPPTAGSGAENWRMARVDGDSNGELNISDLTPIAAHWNESIDGYRIYRRAPGEQEFSLVPDPADAEAEFSISRDSIEIDPGRPVRYRFVDSASAPGTYEYRITAVSLVGAGGGEEEEGTMSTSSALSLEPPTAVLTADKTFGSAPLMIDFDGSASSDSDGNIELYEWDFDGDGTYDASGSEDSASHLYEDVGTFTAGLRVTDDDGLSAMASLEIEIFVCQPVLSMPSPPSHGSGTESDPYIVEQGGQYQLQLLDCGGNDVTTDPLTTYMVSADAGLINGVTAELAVSEIFVGDFVVTATYDSTPNTVESNFYLRVPEPFFIMPDPEDSDWAGVTGSGTEADPYIVHTALFNPDFSMEFGLLANTMPDGSGSSIDVLTLTWEGVPSFTVQFVQPGTFTANTFTASYFHAVSGIGATSQPVYVRSESLPD